MAVKRKRVIRKRASKRAKKKLAKKRSTRKVTRKQQRLARKGARKPRGSSSKQGVQSQDVKKKDSDHSGSVTPMTREEEKNPEMQPFKIDVHDLENWPRIGLFGDAENNENLLNQRMVVPPQHPSLMLGLPGGNMPPPMPSGLPAGMMPPFMPGMMMPTPEQYIQMLSASGAPPGQFFPFNFFQNMPEERDTHGTLRQVFNGKRKFTRGGLTKKDLIVNARGKVVSKKMSANAKKKNVKAMLWCTSVKQARKELKIVGFIKINRGEKGVKLYKRAKKIFADLTKDMPSKKKEPQKKMAKKKKKTDAKAEINVFAALKETPIKVESMSVIKES